MSTEYRIRIERIDETGPKEIYSRLTQIPQEAVAIRRIDDALSEPVQAPRKRRKDAGKPRAAAETGGLFK